MFQRTAALGLVGAGLLAGLSGMKPAESSDWDFVVLGPSKFKYFKPGEHVQAYWELKSGSPKLVWAIGDTSSNNPWIEGWEAGQKKYFEADPDVRFLNNSDSGQVVLHYRVSK